MDKFFRAESIEIKGKTRSGKVKVAKYDRSFMALLIQNEKAKEFYNEIKNYCLAFERVKVRPSWGAEGFAAGTETVVKMIVRGGVLCVCLAFAPNRYSQNTFPHLDLSDDRELQNTPFAVPVRNPAEHKIARRLVAEAFTSRCVYTVDFPTRADYVSSLKTQNDEALIKKKLIRVTELEMSEADAKKALALALQAEAEEEKEIEDIGKKRRKSKKSDAAEQSAIEEEAQASSEIQPEDAVVEETAERSEEEVVFAPEEESVVERSEPVEQETEEEPEEQAPMTEEEAVLPEEPEETPQEAVVEEGTEELPEQAFVEEQASIEEKTVEEQPVEEETEEEPTEEQQAEELVEEQASVEEESAEQESIEDERKEEAIPDEQETIEEVAEEDFEEVGFETDDEALDVDYETEEEEIVFELADDGLVIEVKYDRSFTARIIQNEGAKRYYSELKNLCLSYDLKSRVSWKGDTFHLGRKTYLIFKVRGKTLCLYLALDPSAFESRIYHQKDVSNKKSYQGTPMMVRVKSPLGLKKAKALIEKMMQEAGILAKARDEEDFANLYPYEDTEALIEKKLIKRVERKLDREESERVIESGKLEESSQEPVEQPIEEQQTAEEPVEQPIKEQEEITEPVEQPIKEQEEITEPFEESAEGQEQAILDEEKENAEPEAEQEDVEEIEEVFFELDDTPEELSEEEEKELTGDDEPEEEGTLSDNDEEDVEDVSFELVEEETEDEVQDTSGMESYGRAEADGKYVTLKKYMRGFAAKMKQGDQDRKDYYAEIKAKMLSYKGVKVSASFPGESYKKGSRALLKARVRGKTLCLFFALNVDNYKQTVYRQQYKGDVKAYAATPMMVRVRSEQGLKRALRLIEEMERNYALALGEPVSVVDVRREFLYEETPALVEQGLIKTRLVTVTQYEAEQLLKKKAR